VEITTLTSRQEGDRPVSEVHPSLVDRIDLPLENLEPTDVAKRADCVFSCLPHGASAQAVRHIIEAGCRVVDFSADYRLRDPAVFEAWYGQPQQDPERLETAVYGLPELFREQIREARLVANPGCHPTTAILALAPLLAAELVEPQDIVIDSKTGVSGGGRSPKPAFHFPECNESVTAYGLGTHRHTPKIDQVLSIVSRQAVEVVFAPHLIPMNRGILATAYARPKGDVTEEQLLAQMREFYNDEPFVRVVGHLPRTRDTTGTNFCDVTVRLVRGRVLALGALDNLVKGASGAAVQNFNLMYGLDETTAL
jgi:N-acetyl-gamma-glutamyl-phosphate reductase